MTEIARVPRARRGRLRRAGSTSWTFGGDADGFALMLFRHRARTPVARPDVVAKRRLGAVRTRTLELVAPLDELSLTRQWSPLMSPIAWDLGHIANFEEQWVRRAHSPDRRRDDTARQRDHLYDAVAHTRATRGALPILDRTGALAYLDDVRRLTTTAIERSRFPAADPFLRDGFVHAMLAQHEAQHTETMLQTIQLAGLPYEPARRAVPPAARVLVDERRQARVPAGTFVMGTDDRVLAYDNERPAHGDVPPSHRRRAGDGRAYLTFVDDGGYRRPTWATTDGRGSASPPCHRGLDPAG
jgi:iron(II)-dependent oxidoreductase